MKYDNVNEYSPHDDDNEHVYLDDFDEEKSKWGGILISCFIISLAIGGIGLLGWVFYQGKVVSSDDAPLIKADKNPAKVKPQDPGGMVVANMDKTVYDNFSSNASRVAKTEKLLPAPEEPVDRIQVINGQPKKTEIEETASVQPLDTEESTAKDVDNDTNAADEEENTAPLPSQATLSEAVKESSGDGIRPLTESDLKLAPEEQTVKAQEAAATSTPQETESNASGYKVQLAAFKTEKDAIDSWEKIQQNYKELLGSLHYYIERKDVEGKGTFYRLQAGIISKESEARLLCKKLAEVNQGCFVVE